MDMNSYKGPVDDPNQAPYLKWLWSNKLAYTWMGFVILSLITDKIFDGMLLHVFWMSHVGHKYELINGLQDFNNFIVIYVHVGLIFTIYTCIFMAAKWDGKININYLNLKSQERIKYLLIGVFIVFLSLGMNLYEPYGFVFNTNKYLGFFLSKVFYIFSWMAINQGLILAWMSFVSLFSRK